MTIPLVIINQGRANIIILSLILLIAKIATNIVNEDRQAENTKIMDPRSESL